MRRAKQGAKTAVREKEVFVGIDVHKENWQVTVRGPTSFPIISYQNLTSNSLPTTILPELDILILFQPI